MRDRGLDALRLLVVDDDEDVRTVLRAMLGALGIEDVREVGDGAAALEALRARPADIVITDIAMEPVNGIELLRILRTDPDSPDRDVAVIILTGHAGMDRVIEARDYGASAFLAKPMTRRDLRERIVAIVDSRGGESRPPCSPARSGDGADPEESPDYLVFRDRIKDTNINDQALLATDYLNHFNELIMLLEMLPDCPEVLEELTAWCPKSYKEHFRDSNLSYKDLAIAAYDHVPSRFLRPFEATVERIDRLVETDIAAVEAAIAADDHEELRRIVRAALAELEVCLGTANAIIHGSVPVMKQHDIDGLFTA